MTRLLPAPVDDLLSRQDGVLTRVQALQSGLTDKQVVAALRSGRWQRLHTGVYAAFSGPPPRRAQLWAAVLRAGPEAVLSHQTAAELHGIGDQSAVIHVTVAPGRQVTSAGGLAVHRCARIDQVRHPAQLPPRTRIEETVLDLAGAASRLDDALGWVFRGCGSRRTTPERLAAALAQRARMRWRTELSAAFGLAAGGVHSLLEFRYVNRVERPHGLPAPGRQYAVVRGAQRQYQDANYQRYELVVELDGLAAHPAESRWRDVRRDNANTAAGQRTLRYGWADVTERPCFVAAQVADALAVRGWTGTLRRCGPSCGLPGVGPGGT